MSDNEASATLSYYVSSLRVRRELIPLYEGGKLTAYRCVTYRADGPRSGGRDKVVADQVAFDDILIGMKLMKPRNPLQWTYAKAWRGLSVDKLVSTRPPEGEPLETLLPILT